MQEEDTTMPAGMDEETGAEMPAAPAMEEEMAAPMTEEETPAEEEAAM